MLQYQLHHIFLQLCQKRLARMLYEWHGQLQYTRYVTQQHHIFLRLTYNVYMYYMITEHISLPSQLSTSFALCSVTNLISVLKLHTLGASYRQVLFCN